MNSNTVTLIVAGMGIFGTLFAPLLNAHLSSRNEWRKWVRQERLTTYASFLRIATAAGRTRRRYKDMEARLTELQTNLDRVGLERLRQEVIESSDRLTAIMDEYYRLNLIASPIVREPSKAILSLVVFQDTTESLDDDEWEARQKEVRHEMSECIERFQQAVRQEMGVGKL